MKRLIRFLACAACVALTIGGAAFAEHTGLADKDDTEKAQVVQLLEIMNGDENGNLKLDAPVTRAEFIKMVISATPYKSHAQSTGNVSLFTDVKKEHWAIGYISTAVKNGLINGYLDGSFRPENEVKLEEGVTVLLKLLGYTNDDLNGVYPAAQLAKYADIDLDTGIDAVKGQTLTRRDCMRLLYNTLCTPTKTGAYYCTTLGYAVDANNTIDLTALISADMVGPFINLDSSWKSRVSFSGHAALTVYRDGKAASANAIEEYDVYYYSTKCKTVWCYVDKSFGNLDAIQPTREEPQSITVAGKTYSLKLPAVKRVNNTGELFKDDYVMLLLDKDGAVADLVGADLSLYERYADREDIDPITEIEQTLEEPIVVKDLDTFAEDIPFPLEEATIMLDTEPISAKDIRVNDVLYYSELFHSVWVFRETESGVCQTILPNRENPTSVTVGGKTYALSTDDVVYKFSNYGTFKTDTFVTLLLGKDGSAVDVLPAGTEIIGDGDKQTSYAEIVTTTLKGPYIVPETKALLADTGITLETATVFKNGKQASVSDIDRYNVYYYSKLLNTLWLFDDTAIGSIEAISPTRVSPTSITVSGKTYSLESDHAKYAVSSLGSYKVGDRVTLLLGKDGAVAGFADVTVASRGQTVYGVVTANEKKQYTDADGKSYTAKSVTVFATNGETYTYEYDGTFTVGTPVIVTMNGSKFVISGLASPKSMSYALGAIEAVEKGLFAENVEIIDYYDENNYATVLPSRIEGSTPSYSDIKYYEVNQAGELTVLILDNYTGDLVEYGLITSVNGSTYKYVLDGEETTYYSGDTRYYVTTGGAYFARTGNQITDLGNLRKNVELKLIAGDTGYSAYSKAYPIDDDVRVYIRVNGTYKVFDLDELESGNYSTMIGYYDKNPDEGGKIRVIMAY